MSRISAKNQITIPAEVMRSAGLRPGDDVQVVVRSAGRLEVVKLEDLIAEFAGALGSEEYPEGYLREIRAEWP